MIKLYRFKYSTNVERVALALAHKQLPVESIEIDPEDRSLVRRVSGQDFVPVVDDGGTVVWDSMPIVAHLEKRYPQYPLYPAEASRRAEMDVFIDWFNRVWKRPPNLIYDELQKPSPDRERIEAWGRDIASAMDTFEAMLSGRDYLMGDAFSAADVCAYPFLRYATFRAADDTHLFHEILIERMPMTGRHPRLEAWIERCDARPRV